MGADTSSAFVIALKFAIICAQNVACPATRHLDK
jgi:hypothetical protein